MPFSHIHTYCRKKSRKYLAYLRCSLFDRVIARCNALSVTEWVENLDFSIVLRTMNFSSCARCCHEPESRSLSRTSQQLFVPRRYCQDQMRWCLWLCPHCQVADSAPDLSIPFHLRGHIIVKRLAVHHCQFPDNKPVLHFATTSILTHVNIFRVLVGLLYATI